MTLSQADQSLLAEVKRMHRSDDCNLAFLTRYMDQGADPNARPEQGEGVLETLLNPAIRIHRYKRAQALQLMVERGGNLLAHGPKFLVLLEEDHTAVDFILPAMREREEKSGIACMDDQGNNPLHWMLGSTFSMITVKSLLEDRLEGRQDDDPHMHDDWLHGVNAQGNTPMMALWIAMLEHTKTNSDTEFECTVALIITSHFLTLGGDARLINHKGECTMDLMAQYQDLSYASELPADAVLRSEISAWKMHKQTQVFACVAPPPRL